MTATTLSHFPSITTTNITNKSFQIDFETWKPLSISDSFSKDLIRQFDLRRSLLNSNYGSTLQNNGGDEKEEEKVDDDDDDDRNDSGVIERKDNNVILRNNNKNNDSYNNTDDYVRMGNNKELNNLYLNNSSPTAATPRTATRLSTATPIGLHIDKSIKNDHNDNNDITIKDKSPNRNLLRKSSQYFRQRIKKIKMNNNKSMKEQPVVSTSTTDNSIIETANNDTMILHYPPKPLEYSPNIHPAADNEAKKRRSSPFTFGSTTNNNNEYKYKQRVNHISSININTNEPKKRKETYQPDKRKSFIIRSLLHR